MEEIQRPLCNTCLKLHIPVEMEEAEPWTSSTKELVEKSRLRGSRRCQVLDSPGAALPPRIDGPGAELESLARSKGLVAAKLGRGMLWPLPPPDEDDPLLEVLWRAPPEYVGRWVVGDGEWLPPIITQNDSYSIFLKMIF